MCYCLKVKCAMIQRTSLHFQPWFHFSDNAIEFQTTLAKPVLVRNKLFFLKMCVTVAFFCQKNGAVRNYTYFPRDVRSRLVKRTTCRNASVQSLVFHSCPIQLLDLAYSVTRNDTRSSVFLRFPVPPIRRTMETVTYILCN